MSITIRARNFRGLVKADLDVSGIALVAGLNEAAKTSLLQGVAAALTGEALAGIDIKKKDIPALVRDGTGKAMVEIAAPDGAASLEWPAGNLATKGSPPRSSSFAAGIQSLATMSVKDRLVAIEPYLKISPTKKDLSDELGEEFSEEAINRLWELIERDGWDATHKRQCDNRAKAAGEWEAVTRQHWGSTKARNWRPERWYPAIDEYSEEELAQRLRTAEHQVEIAIASRAVGEAEAERLRGLADALPDREARLKDTQKALGLLQRRLDDAKQKRQKLPTTSASAGVACPHCGQLIDIKHEGPAIKLEKMAVFTESDVKKTRIAIAEADGEVSRYTSEVAAETRALSGAEAAVEEARAAKESFDQVQGQGSAVSVDAAETARMHAENARLALSMWRQVQQAEAAAERWETLQAAIGVLAPDGLRQKKLGEGIEDFNLRQLRPLYEAAGWPAVTLTDDLGCTYAGRPYALSSESAKFRARTILQLAQAKLDQSALTIVDGVDILDNHGREELFGLLADCGLQALVAMTLSRPGLAPDLAKHGLGFTWWISNGVTSPLAEVLQEMLIKAAMVDHAANPVIGEN